MLKAPELLKIHDLEFKSNMVAGRGFEPLTFGL